MHEFISKQRALPMYLTLWRRIFPRYLVNRTDLLHLQRFWGKEIQSYLQKTFVNQRKYLSDYK